MIRDLSALAAALALLPAVAVAAPFTLADVPMGSDFALVADGPKDQPAEGYLEVPKAKPVDGLITLWTIGVLPVEHPGLLGVQKASFDCDKQL